MNDLELPIIRNNNEKKRILSMDEYLEFVQFNLKHTFNKEAYLKWKKMIVVNVPFSIS